MGMAGQVRRPGLGARTSGLGAGVRDPRPGRRRRTTAPSCTATSSPATCCGPATAVTGVVDWVETSWGPAWLDVAHCRTNLAITHGTEVADRFGAAYQRLTGSEPQPLLRRDGRRRLPASARTPRLPHRPRRARPARGAPAQRAVSRCQAGSTASTAYGGSSAARMPSADHKAEVAVALPAGVVAGVGRGLAEVPADPAGARRRRRGRRARSRPTTRGRGRPRRRRPRRGPRGRSGTGRAGCRSRTACATSLRRRSWSPCSTTVCSSRESQRQAGEVVRGEVRRPRHRGPAAVRLGDPDWSEVGSSGRPARGREARAVEVRLDGFRHDVWCDPPDGRHGGQLHVDTVGPNPLVRQ